MYPILRVATELVRHRRAPPLGLFDIHVSHHRIWPVDIDLWMELNNGRTLTLYDLGRIVLLTRTGLVAAMRRAGWVGTVAGASIRYRRRLQVFQRIEMQSRIVGWDARFLYVEQAMYRGAACCGHLLIRMAVTDRTRMIPAAEAAAALDVDQSPPLPDWVAAWAAADARRPWPPMG